MRQNDIENIGHLYPEPLPGFPSEGGEPKNTVHLCAALRIITYRLGEPASKRERWEANAQRTSGRGEIIFEQYMCN